MIEIRKANELDIKEVYQLINELERGSIECDAFYQRYHSLEKNYSIFLACINDQVVGLISIYYKHYLHHNKPTIEIVELIVNETYRNKSIGQSLLQFIEQKAIEEGIEELELCTSTWRKDAHRFYERNGFIMNHYNYIKKIR